MDRLIDFIDFFQAKYVALFLALVSIFEFLYIRFMVNEYHKLEKNYNDLKETNKALSKEYYSPSKKNRASSSVILTSGNSQPRTANNRVSETITRSTSEVADGNTDNSVQNLESRKTTRQADRKIHFYLRANNQSVFIKWTDIIDDESKFKATLISENKATIELIDVNRIKSLPGIGEVVFESGTIQLKDAISFKPIASGVIIKEQQGPTAYWKIDEKIKVEYTK